MKISKATKKIIAAAIAVPAAAAILVTAVFLFAKSRGPEITNTFINDKLEEVSELTSSRLTYNGLVRYSDGNIPFLTKKAFTMIYCAEVEAGIDLSKVEVEVTDSQVKMRLPKIEVLDVSIDPDSIQFYDEKFALFNMVENRDAIEAIKVAEEDVMEKADVDKLKQDAKEQTELLLENIFESSIGDRTLIISYQP